MTWERTFLLIPQRKICLLICSMTAYLLRSVTSFPKDRFGTEKTQLPGMRMGTEQTAIKSERKSLSGTATVQSRIKKGRMAYTLSNDEKKNKTFEGNRVRNDRMLFLTFRVTL